MSSSEFPAEFSAGSRLGGRYVLRRRIAAGGMGQVWEAVDELLGRAVAVKTPFAALAADPVFRSRFEAEARTTARLSHPGIAQVYDVGEQSSVPYLVMELVDGEPLSATLAREGRLGVERSLDVLAQSATALHAAHSLGIVHRDVKPANILLTSSERATMVKVTDFGIARATDGEALTTTGTLLGSAPYLSPEQALGRPATTASDIYALGVVAYECLAGHRLFAAEAPAALALAHAQETPAALPADVPAGVRALIDQCLAKDPAQRPGALELAQRAAALRSADTALVAPQEQTQLLAPITEPTTQLMPTAARAPGTGATPVDSPVTALRPFAPDPLRRRWQPSLVGVVGGLLALALVAALLQLAREARKPDAAGDARAVTPSSSATATTGATPVDLRDYIGQPYVEARKELKALGYDVTSDPPGSGSSPALVTEVEPPTAAPGSKITLVLARSTARPTTRPTPSAPPVTQAMRAPSIAPTPTVAPPPGPGPGATTTPAGARPRDPKRPSGSGESRKKPKKNGTLETVARARQTKDPR